MWRKVSGYTYFVYSAVYDRLFPHSPVFSAIPLGLASCRWALGCDVKIPEYQNTVISWLGSIAKSVDKSRNLTFRYPSYIIFTLANKEVKT